MDLYESTAQRWLSLVGAVAFLAQAGGRLASDPSSFEWTQLLLLPVLLGAVWYWNRPLLRIEWGGIRLMRDRGQPVVALANLESWGHDTTTMALLRRSGERVDLPYGELSAKARELLRSHLEDHLGEPKPLSVFRRRPARERIADWAKYALLYLR